MLLSKKFSESIINGVYVLLNVKKKKKCFPRYILLGNPPFDKRIHIT